VRLGEDEKLEVHLGASSNPGELFRSLAIVKGGIGWANVCWQRFASDPHMDESVIVGYDEDFMQEDTTSHR
jgi:hypothetical protein